MSDRTSARMTDQPRNAHASIRKHLVVGLAVVLVLGGGVGGWAATVPISGALIAPGSVVVDTNVKKVQHPTGGVVGEILARDGDTVKAGDVVVRLDETVVKASLAIVVKTLNGLYARAARLQAEQQGLDKIAFPPQLTEQARDPDVRDIMASETKLFEVRVNGRTGQKAQLRERVTQLNEEISGLQAQEAAKDKEIALVQQELAKADASTPVMKEAIRTLAQLMSPMVPHLAEEAWALLGGEGLVARAPWPKADPALLVEDNVTLPIQINGKRRAEISVPKTMPAAEVEKIALADEDVVKFLAGQPVKKIIVVPGRIINVVV